MPINPYKTKDDKERLREHLQGLFKEGGPIAFSMDEFHAQTPEALRPLLDDLVMELLEAPPSDSLKMLKITYGGTKYFYPQRQ